MDKKSLKEKEAKNKDKSKKSKESKNSKSTFGDSEKIRKTKEML